jgi:hypothetical protein
MSWIICGSDKQGTPFSFEANSVKGSCRNTLGILLETLKEEDGVETLRDRVSLARKPGLYQLLWDDGSTVYLAGFWIVFGHHYLEDGPFGPPDKDPPYVEDLLEAMTEEVWWKNYPVHPRVKNRWRPTIILEWPSDISYRSSFSPPGLPLPASEIAKDIEDDTGAEYWLERIEEEFAGKDESNKGPIKGQWDFLPANRALVVVIRGNLQFSRVRHEGSFHMVHPQFIGDKEQMVPMKYPEWLDALMIEKDFPQSDEDEHFLGQPLEMPGGRVAFPISGWLTKNLSIWPMFPKDIRHAKLAKRDVGSRALAQFKQAISISVSVLALIVLLSMVVRKATTPVLEDVPQAKPITPQPALSLCSADHEKFMEEFRCQIRAYAMNPNTDQPFCNDKGSSDIVPPLNMDFADLQGLYCGIRDREADLWIWGEKGYDFGQLAATKACFNVLGHPWQYQSEKPYKTKDGRKLLLPEPNSFLSGNLSINQLANLVADLNVSCDSMKERIEMQLTGSMLASYVGTKKVGEPGDRSHEAYELRQMAAKKAMMGVRGDLRKCFEAGLVESPYRSNHYRELCDGALRDKDFLVWNKLDRSTEKNTDEDVCHKPDSALLPSRDLDSCSVVSRYERARFGTDEEQDEDSHPDKLWQCHIGLAQKDKSKTKNVQVSWDLKLPVPPNYNLGGSGVKNQLVLDAGLKVLSNKGKNVKELGPCWGVLSEKLSRYEVVHPILTELDSGSWPSNEQQLCGQVCASYYRFQKTNSETEDTWVTPLRDLDYCMLHVEPTDYYRKPNRRLDRLLIPWNYNQDEEWIKPTYSQICAFNLVAQSYFPEGFIVGDLAPPVWSGDSTPTSKMAGDIDGPAAKAAKNLISYGRARSRSTCGYASAQCFASILVEVMGDRSNQPSEWLVEFNKSIKKTAQFDSKELKEKNPWCGLIQPYMGREGVLPEGQLDFPCAKGVSDAQENAAVAVEKLVQNYGGE